MGEAVGIMRRQSLLELLDVLAICEGEHGEDTVFILVPPEGVSFAEVWAKIRNVIDEDEYEMRMASAGGVAWALDAEILREAVRRNREDPEVTAQYAERDYWVAGAIADWYHEARHEEGDA